MAALGLACLRAGLIRVLRTPLEAALALALVARAEWLARAGLRRERVDQKLAAPRAIARRA